MRALKTINWKVFALLLGAGLLGVLAVLPLVFDMLRSNAFGPAPDIPSPLLVAASLLQNGILLAVVIAFGMILSARIGLQMPLVSAWTRGERAPNVGGIVVAGVLLGAGAGAALVALEVLFFLRQLPKAMLPLYDIPLWKRLLGGMVYGGITEELLMRLFLMSLVAWLLGKFWKTPEGCPTPAAFWCAIILVAILFGLGHLPITSVLTPLTPMLVARALLLNGVAGVAFGYLYWRYGLEAAMLGHMSTHVVLQGPGVELIKRML